MAGRPNTFWRAFGPGLLFAGAAVGVSHLVQSTRAGAGYGLSLVLVVVAANLLKFPAFRFGGQYAAATGRSLLEGYRLLGPWALWLFALLTLATMWTVAAAVTVVTAGLLGNLLGSILGGEAGGVGSPVALSAALLALCGALLAVGRFHWFDRVMKVVVVVLTLATVSAAALIAPRIDWGAARLLPDVATWTAKDVTFVAALVGWMPSAIDVAVWQSLWTLARARDAGAERDAQGSEATADRVREVLLDFDIGYLGTALLALAFVLLGAGALHGKGVVFAPSAGGFANQVIEMFAVALGGWARPVIGVAALTVMLSTTLTVADGFPRAIAVLWQRLQGPEESFSADVDGGQARRVYLGTFVVLASGSLVVIGKLMTSLADLVDLATTLSFLTAPLLAWMNHRVIHGDEVPLACRPSTAMRALSWLGQGFMFAFAAIYVWIRFGPT